MLIPLFDFTKQFETSSGTLNVGGSLKVFRNNTDTLATIYEDAEGTTVKTNPCKLDSNGRAGYVYVTDGALYRLEVYSRTGALLWTISDMAGIGAVSGGGGDITIGCNDGSIIVENYGPDYNLRMPPKHFLIMHANPMTGNAVGGDVTKLQFESDQATSLISTDLEIDRENSRITGMDPNRFYMVHANWFYNAFAMNGSNTAPARIQVDATQTLPIHYYAQAAPVTLSGGFIPMTFIVMGRSFIEFYGKLMDVGPGGSVDYLYLYDLQIMEIHRRQWH